MTSPRARVCVLTAPTRGAVAVVRVWGPEAIGIVNKTFRPVKDRSLADTKLGLMRFGRVGSGLGDEVVAVIIGHDPPEVEVHCHAGAVAVELVANSLVEAGAERRQPVAWVREHASTRLEAEALVDLARAPTLRTAEILLEQSQGALSRDLAKIAQLIETDITLGREALALMLEVGHLGNRLISGWKVVLAGRPNVGKSSLMNALAGYERAIVDPAPGTTRDVVAVRTAFEGWPVELSDTAGLRDSDDPTEQAGIARARASHAESDLILLLLDRSEPLVEDDMRLLDSLPNPLIVASKSDCPAAWEPWSDRILCVSALEKVGLDQLSRAIVQRLITQPPMPGAGVPFRKAHIRTLENALEHIDMGEPHEAAFLLKNLVAETLKKDSTEFDRSPHPRLEPDSLG